MRLLSRQAGQLTHHCDADGQTPFCCQHFQPNRKFHGRVVHQVACQADCCVDGWREHHDRPSCWRSNRIVACADNNVLRIWCAPHKIDIVVKEVAKGINNGVWVQQAYTFSIYLRTQDNLIMAMNMKCSKKTNRWAHISRLLNFYKLYRRPLLEHTKDKRLDLMPPDQWWIIMYAVAPGINLINVTLAQLQARSLLIAQQ